MSHRLLRRVSGLAVCLQLLIVATVSAHALPGSVLTFSQEHDSLLLSMNMPLEDLIVASPGLEALQDIPADIDLPDADRASLENYFLQHLDLRSAETTYPLSLLSATLRTAQNEHVGDYTELALSWSTHTLVAAQAFPLTLTYDAVMHEVRNHRATVLWQSPGRQPSMLANFGFKTTVGNQQTVLLTQPRE